MIENQRLQTQLRIQQYIIETGVQSSLSVALGNILIQGVGSAKSFLALPYNLFSTWYKQIRNTPPSVLGRKSFRKVITAWECDGINGVNSLIKKVNVSPSMNANAFTALAHHLMESDDVAMAAKMARCAYEIDPRPFRLKWLAFREHNTGNTIEAAAMLSLLPKGTPISASEAAQAARLQAEATSDLHCFVQDGQLKKANQITFGSKHAKLRKPALSFYRAAITWLNKKHALIQAALRFYFPQKGVSSYTIVSACYNVALYLDDYFNSLVQQTLSFKKSIHCVMVDDGSTDDTALVIKRWQKKYPKNITYVHKENGGAASARNFGLTYAKSTWVTFTDPDDFLNKDYFGIVDEFIANSKLKLFMVATNIVFYIDKENCVRDTHPLKYKFTKSQITKVNELNKNIQASTANAFFLKKHIDNSKIAFNEMCKPSFEDSHFVAIYLLGNQNSNVAFLKSARYFFRKNEYNQINLLWEKDEFFDQRLQYGLIDLLNQYNLNQCHPAYLYCTALYDMLCYLNNIINTFERLDFLNCQKKERFLQLVQKVYSLIDEKYILFFDKAGHKRYYQMGILTCLKNTFFMLQQRVYVESYDVKKDELEIKYFTNVVNYELFYINEHDCMPVYTKNVCDNFLGKNFIITRRIWLPLAGFQDTAVLSAIIDRQQAPIFFQNKLYNALPLGEIRKALAPEVINNNEFQYANCWLFIDRDTQADDNAEHLYRYVSIHHPEVNAVFALRKTSHDWKRLSNEGFNLVPWGSPQYDEVLQNCAKIISSHANERMIRTSDKKIYVNQYIFLQYGVTKDDMSKWLNIFYKLNLFITTTVAEWSSIVDNNSRYKFCEKTVRCLGFPRHDLLLEKDELCKKQILVMPTWRKSLVGTFTDGTTREIKHDFSFPNYLQVWSSFLRNKRLRSIIQKNNYEVLFFPHAIMQPYINEFQLPQHITVALHSGCGIQKVFKQSALMITDFSSVAFEMTYLQRPIIYYQFDEHEFFSGNKLHMQKGYFDYRQHGFGPVVTDENALLDSLENLLTQNAVPDEIYQKRMNTTFACRDQNNCARVFAAICDLDKPNPEGYVNKDILRTYTQMALNGQDSGLAIARAEKLCQLDSSEVSRQLLHDARQLKVCELNQEAAALSAKAKLLEKEASNLLMKDNINND